MAEKDNKHVRAFCKNKMKPGEKLITSVFGYVGNAMGKGKDKQVNGQLILTDLRICFYRKGFFGEQFEEIPLSKISSVEHKSLLGHRVLVIHTSHNHLEFKTFWRKELLDDLYQKQEEIRHSVGQKAPSPSIQNNSSDGDIAERLKKLSELHQASILTDEEFATKKAELLSQL